MAVRRLLGWPAPQHLFALARRVAADAEFIVTPEQRLTRRQIFAHVDALAAGLQALGIRQGDPVATLLPACPEAVYGLFQHHYAGWLGVVGAFLAGGRVVLMDRFNPQQMLEYIQKERVSQLGGSPTMYRLLLSTPGQ